MAEMVTVGGIRYRAEDAKRLGLTPDTKAHAKKVAANEAPVGLSEAEFKLTQAAATTARKAAGKTDPANTAVVGTQPAGGATGDAGTDPGTSGDAGTGSK